MSLYEEQRQIIKDYLDQLLLEIGVPEEKFDDLEWLLENVRIEYPGGARIAQVEWLVKKLQLQK